MSNPSESEKKPTVLITIGMAGSGKTTFMQVKDTKAYDADINVFIQRLNADLNAENKNPYVINLDPAVFEVPFTPNIDIRDTVKYKEVMKQ